MPYYPCPVRRATIESENMTKIIIRLLDFSGLLTLGIAVASFAASLWFAHDLLGMIFLRALVGSLALAVGLLLLARLIEVGGVIAVGTPAPSKASRRPLLALLLPRQEHGAERAADTTRQRRFDDAA